MDTCVSLWSNLRHYKGKKFRSTLKAVFSHTPGQAAMSLERPGWEQLVCLPHLSVVGAGQLNPHSMFATILHQPVLLLDVHGPSET